jgi:hypothetical protein
MISRIRHPSGFHPAPSLTLHAPESPGPGHHSCTRRQAGHDDDQQR